MKERRQLAAIFFLNVIIIMMLHDALPHVHHFHGKIGEVSEYTETRHDSQEYDNHHSDEQDSLLSSLLDTHLHFFHTHEFVPLTKGSNLYSINKAFPVLAIVETYDLLPESEKHNLHRYTLFKQAFYNNPFLLNCSLRAPPSLG
jgi:Family of unknown function (DUF6769)